MSITMVTGGARSGKSGWAQALALDQGGDDVSILATAEARDEEMARRIAGHRRDRPPAWRTIEEPLHVAEALATATTSVVLLDCLTVFVSNVLLARREASRSSAKGCAAEPGLMAAVDEAVEALLDVARGRAGSLIIVTNEVGLGLVPAAPLARWYRDALGGANRRFGEAADRVVFMISGLPLTVKGAPPAKPTTWRPRG